MGWQGMQPAIDDIRYDSTCNTCHLLPLPVGLFSMCGTRATLVGAMEERGQRFPPVSATVLKVCKTTGQLMAGFQSFPSGGSLNHLASMISHTFPCSQGSSC